MTEIDKRQRTLLQAKQIDSELSLLRLASLQSKDNPIERNIHNKNILKLQEQKLQLALQSYL